MNVDQLTELGTIKRPHGLKGELKVQIDSFYFDDIQALTALFIEKGDTFLPFFIEEFQPQASQTIIKFESIESKEQASSYTSKKLFALTEQLSEVLINVKEQYIGKTVIDSNKNEIGEIIDVDEMPTQLLFKVLYNNKQVLLPFHESMLVEESANSVTINIPEGLLDL